jgi:hypothetical protein
VEGRGFAFFHAHYGPTAQGWGRRQYFRTSADGRTWSEPQLIAHAGEGHYQLSAASPRKIATVFDYHPLGIGLEGRTNLHYLESEDFGATWRTVTGEPAALPLADTCHPARIRDYKAEGLKVYLMDLVLDEQDRPVVLYLTTHGHEPGPKNQPRTWATAQWTGEQWRFQPAMTSDSNYDMGSLYLEAPDCWRLIGPTQPGPQAFNPGGEVAQWISRDRGATWTMTRQLTERSPRNHTFVRRPLNAHPGFYAFWADGDPRRPSESGLYFTDREGSAVWRLPPLMTQPTAVPQEVAR